MLSQAYTLVPHMPAPFTWDLVKILLDANSTLRYRKRKGAKKAADYASHDNLQGQPRTGFMGGNGNGESDGDEMGMGTSMTGGSDARSVEHTIGAENESLLRVVRNQSTERIITHVTY